jgi:ribosome-binding factor A
MRPYRKQKIASLVHKIISDAIAHRLQDPRVSPLTTVTRVEMTNDLLIAKVYLSIQADASAERRTLIAIRHAGAFLQRLLAGALTLRHCPELRFEIDEAAKGVRRTLELLAENRRREPELYEGEESGETVGLGEAEPSDAGDPGPAANSGECA